MIFLKEYSHRQLTELIGRYGSILIEPTILERLAYASIEPDIIYKEKIFELTFESLKVLFQWLVEHTIYARKLANHFLNEAINSYKNNDDSWITFLGWVFHFISDWSMPYHSPISKSNPVAKNTFINFIAGGLQEYLIKGRERNKKSVWDFFRGGLENMLLGLSKDLVNLEVNHDEFENLFDAQWEVNESLIIKYFRKSEKSRPSKDLKVAIQQFNDMMDDLRNLCNNLRREWIHDCSNKEFAKYATKIALVLHFTYQIVIQ